MATAVISLTLKEKKGRVAISASHCQTKNILKEKRKKNPRELATEIR